AGSRRGAPQRRLGLRGRRDDWRAARYDHSVPLADSSGRQFLAAAVSRRHAAAGRAARSLSCRVRRASKPGTTHMTVARRFFTQEWSRLGGAIAIGLATLSALSPAFLTEYNLYVVLRSFCVVLVVAFAQMLTLAVGQLNLAVGALGGLVAIA